MGNRIKKKKKNNDLASENSTDNRRCKMEVREWSLIRNHLRQSSSAKSISSTPTEWLSSVVFLFKILARSSNFIRENS